MTDEALERYYQESLEERLIGHLSEVQNIPLEQAMDIYYNSHLAERIHTGKEGVQYLDYRVLTQMLLDTEPELFRVNLYRNTAPAETIDDASVKHRSNIG